MALVALRFTIGLHFFREGASKIVDPDWSSAGFLRQAKGPFAPWFHGMLKDEDGLLRLNFNPDGPQPTNESPVGSKQQDNASTTAGEQANESKAGEDKADRQSDNAVAATKDRIDVSITLREWGKHKERLADYYGFDNPQRDKAEKFFERSAESLKRFFRDNNEAINNYFNGLDRRARNTADAARSSVESLVGQSNQTAADLRRERDRWLMQVEQMWATLEGDLNHVASFQQKAQQGGSEYRIPRPGDRWMDVDFVDRFIPVFDVTVGALLMFGLFTRFTAIVASLFLGSVMLTQWPWSAGAIPIDPQLVEMLALLVVASVGAGRWAGLDVLIRRFRKWCCPPNREGTEHES